jgi:peptide/nickel transport system permease protein
VLTYLARRILAMIPTLLGITFVTFLIMNFAPGDPISTRFRGAENTDAEAAASRDRLADAIRAKKKLLGMVREDRSVLAWDTNPRASHDEGPATIGLAGRRGEDDGWLRALAASRDGQLAAGGDSKRVLLVDAASGRVRARLEGASSTITALAFSADGARVIAGDGAGGVHAWDVASGSPAWQAQEGDRPIRDLAALPDGRVALVSDDGRLCILDGSGHESACRVAHVGGARALAVSRDGSRAWTGGVDRKLLEWDLASLTSARTVHEGIAINDLALSPDESFLVAASEDRSVMRIAVREESDPGVRELGAHSQAATAVVITPDGSTAFSGGRDEIIHRFDLAGAPGAQTGVAMGRVYGLAMSPDGATLYSVSESWRSVPVPQRYFSWLSRIARFDFDRSFKDDRPVMAKVGEALPVTLLLNGIAILLIYLIAVPLGVLAAARRGSTFDHASSIALFALYSVPSFWAGTLLIMAFSSERAWNILPSTGLHSPDAADLSYLSWLKDALLHLVLPIVVFVYAGFASLSRYARTSMLESIGQDYVRTARAKGLSEAVVLWKHAFRNSLITIVTLVGNLLPGLIGGSVIIESIFSIHGMGKLGFDSILARDYPVVMALTTFSALLTLLGILLSDVLYSVVDPRITHA